jgi:hypothetical protein
MQRALQRAEAGDRVPQPRKSATVAASRREASRVPQPRKSPAKRGSRGKVPQPRKSATAADECHSSRFASRSEQSASAAEECLSSGRVHQQLQHAEFMENICPRPPGDVITSETLLKYAMAAIADTAAAAAATRCPKQWQSQME